MLRVLVVLVFFALAAEVRADAWVPFGPQDFLSRDVLRLPDGTLVSAYGTQDSPLYLTVDSPGGEPDVKTLADRVPEFDVAAASGGWVAVAWTDLKGRMLVAIRQPDGTIVRRVLDSGLVSAPAVGIDSSGTVLVAWRVQRCRYAGDCDWSVRWAGGTGLTRGSELPGASAVDVVVSPAGHRVLAWATGDGTFAQLDDAPAARIGARSWDVVAAVNDAGAAVVAADQRGPSVAQHPAGGSWSALDDVADGHVIDAYLLDDSRQVSAVLAADDQAAVAWLSRDYPGPFGVYGSAGTIGGDWGPATRLSSVLWEAQVPPFVTLGPAGEPWVTWDEGVTRTFTRSAKPVRGALPDTTPLRATLTLSARRGRVKARVRCSKPCDAVLRVGESENERELRANRTSSLWLDTPGARRVRATVLVADRAGNVQRATRTLRPGRPTKRSADDRLAHRH
jgi:hypothetical protein